MYHLYAGAGTVSDSSGTNRAIQAVAMISDQLLDKNGVPVHVTPGRPLTPQSYIFRMSDWCIAVDKIGTFFGQRGTITIFLQPPPININDIEWVFGSDATADYQWGGDISSMTQPNIMDWPNYGYLPNSFKFRSPGPGPGLLRTIRQLFVHPAGSNQYNLEFVLQRA